MTYEIVMTRILIIIALSIIPLAIGTFWLNRLEQKDAQKKARDLDGKQKIIDARKKKALFRKKRLKMKSIKYQRKW